jgi:AraC-like DNA-binding protein
LERIKVDSVADGSYVTIHRNSVEEVVEDLRERRADVVLLSATRYDSTSTARLAAMVNEFPRVPAFALLTDIQKSTPHSVLSLGHIGIRSLIDVRNQSGWKALREVLVGEHSKDIQQVALSELSHDLVVAHSDCWRFFELLFTHRPQVASVRQIARLMNVIPTTLISRFYRLRLPSPKRYIEMARLMRAARLLENPGLSVSSVARQLEYSSPQAFSRHVRKVMKMSPVQFRKTYTGERMLQMFRQDLIQPYLSTLLRFHPVDAKPSWVPSDDQMDNAGPSLKTLRERFLDGELPNPARDL